MWGYHSRPWAAGAVAGMGIAAGTSVATHYIASHIGELESKFAELIQLFKELKLSASLMADSIRCLKVQLESISTNLDNVRQTQASSDVGSSLLSALDCLCVKFNELNYEQFYQD